MNNVIAYKQFSLGEGLAELFAPEIKNLEAFKASVVASAKNFRSMFGVGFDQTCYNDYTKGGGSDTWKDGCTDHNKS